MSDRSHKETVKYSMENDEEKIKKSEGEEIEVDHFIDEQLESKEDLTTIMFGATDEEKIGEMSKPRARIRDEDTYLQWISLISTLDLKTIGEPFYYLKQLEKDGWIDITGNDIKILKKPKD